MQRIGLIGCGNISGAHLRDPETGIHPRSSHAGRTRGHAAGAPPDRFTIQPGAADDKDHARLFYHNGTPGRIGQNGQSLRRSVRADELFFREDGTAGRVLQTREGINEPVK